MMGNVTLLGIPADVKPARFWGVGLVLKLFKELVMLMCGTADAR
jgi:hypothetical protein